MEVAKAYLSKAKMAEALRQAQAVVFPLAYGMSLEKTAEAIGVSPGWACQLRNRFIKEGKIIEMDKPLRGGRRRENMTIEEEKEFLLPFFEKAKSGGILIVNDIKNAMDRRLGRQVALASAYNLLHRHGWRKLAPDERHPQSDVIIQDAWEKNSLKCKKSHRCLQFFGKKVLDKLFFWGKASDSFMWFNPIIVVNKPF